MSLQPGLLATNPMCLRRRPRCGSPVFSDLMTAVAPAFHSVDHIADFNLNYRKCCWVQYGTEERESLWQWLSENCGEFREMQIGRHAKLEL